MGLLRALTIFAVIAGPTILSGTIAGQAVAADGREQVRLALLDSCVIGEWHTRQVKDKIAEECKCASAKAAKDMSGAQVAAFKTALPKSQSAIWTAATKACFKSVAASAKP